MNTDERNLIEGLFQRLRQAETQSGPRDAEAEALIQGLMAQQPAAPYLLSQVVLVQEQALQNLQGRVEQLERDLAERPQGGGFLGGLFGGRSQASQPSMPSRTPPATGNLWDQSRFASQGASAMRPGMQPGAQGGGFMAGALQTAMGVAGGVLLGNAIAGLFAGDAQAAETPAEPAAAAPEEPEAGMEEEAGGGFFDGFFGGEDDEGF
ncbi:MAG: DUF2076 domain-containing protein [Bdellovibrio bacteriovorus]